MKNYDKFLLETFGEPIGMYAGDAPEGVRSAKQEMVCPDCGTMPIDGSCGCDHSGGEDEGEVCAGCGMMVVDGQCGCDTGQADICPKCGMMPINGVCGCAAKLTHKKSSCGCGAMNQSTCQCG